MIENCEAVAKRFEKPLEQGHCKYIFAASSNALVTSSAALVNSSKVPCYATSPLPRKVPGSPSVKIVATAQDIPRSILQM